MTFFRVLLFALLTTGLVAVTSGCDSILDTEPAQSISEERATTTPDNVVNILIGAYEQVGDDDVYGGQVQLLTDLMADDGEVEWTGTFEEPLQAWQKNILVSNGFVQDAYEVPFEAINETNNVLSGLDVLPEGQRGQIEGEARFIRGMMYFELARLFGKTYVDGNPSENPAVPISLDPTREVGEDDNLPRSTVEEVYTQAIDDLTAAKDLLPESNPRGDVTYANTYVASALLSRVYLMQTRYAEAAAEASRVIESEQYALTETFADAFNNGSDPSETIYSIRFTAQDNVDESLNLFYASEDNGGRADVRINDAHLALYEDGDDRGELFYTDPEGRRTGKYVNNVDANVAIVRLAEMYLTRAEANFREGTSVGDTPANDLAVIRERAGLDAIPAGNLTLDQILLDRKLELMFEGHLLHDLKRTERSIGELPFNDESLVYPIPQREIDANPNLTQNPGYGS